MKLPNISGIMLGMVFGACLGKLYLQKNHNVTASPAAGKTLKEKVTKTLEKFGITQ